MKLVTSLALSHPWLRRPLAFAVSIVLVVSLLVPLAGQAQEPLTDRVTVPVKLKYIEPRHVADTLRKLGIQFEQIVDLKTIVVSGEARQVQFAQDLIATLDEAPEPARSVEVQIYVLAGTQEPNSSGDLPEVLWGVARTLESSLGYRGFTLIDSLLLRSKDGSRGGVSGGGRQLDEEGESVQTLYEFGFEHVSILDREEVRVMRFDDLWFETGLNSSGPSKYYESALRTDVEIREGQTAVIGKATPVGTEQALVLVVSAEIVD